MSRKLWADVDAYVGGAVGTSDPVLEAALRDSEAAGLPAINVSATQGKFLYLLARIQRARRSLEIGTLAGYSTIWLARALEAGGRLVTLEAEARHAEVARVNLERAGVLELVDLRVGLALETLPQVERDGCGPFDLVFIDADKVSTTEYFAWVLKLTRVGSVIIVDNVVRNGAVLESESLDVNVQGMRRFFEMVAREKRVEATVIQTVGSKGYDGFAVGYVVG